MRFLPVIALLCITPAHSAPLRWSQAPDGHWEYIDPDVGQWTHMPEHDNRWRYAYPGWEWRRDPNGNWQLVPPQQ